jgi:Flp pilus assembly protein TadG
MVRPPLHRSRLAARAGRALRSLLRDRAGVSVVEFALCLPVLMTLGMYGVEISHMVSVNMQISQLALSVADNASRLGQTDNSAVAPTVAETDIDAVMFGATRQGSALEFEQNGRVILSSLERHTNGRQYIHWQRCVGELDRDSAYGNDSDLNGLTGTPLVGLGQTGRVVTANAGQAVMFVEVYYTYQPLFGDMFTGPRTFRHESAFVVRDDRELSGGGGDGLTGVNGSAC